MVSQSLLALLANGTRGPPTTRPPPEPPYDHSGALWYVVTVVSVYAMAIMFMIVSHINRRSGKSELDRAVSAYLRSAPSVRIEEERQRRRNLKRAMQPFIRLALEHRTVGVQVWVAAGSGHLLTDGSLEALPGIPGLMAPMLTTSAERLAVSDRVVVSRRSSRARRPSGLPGGLLPAESLESGWQSDGAEQPEDAGSSSAGASAAAVPNEKAVQCARDPQETLANRAQRLLPVASVTDLGSSASSLQYRAMMLHHQEPPRQQHSPVQRWAYEPSSATRTNVPRFLAVPGGRPRREYV